MGKPWGKIGKSVNTFFHLKPILYGAQTYQVVVCFKSLNQCFNWGQNLFRHQVLSISLFSFLPG